MINSNSPESISQALTPYFELNRGESNNQPLPEAERENPAGSFSHFWSYINSSGWYQNTLQVLVDLVKMGISDIFEVFQKESRIVRQSREECIIFEREIPQLKKRTKILDKFIMNRPELFQVFVDELKVNGRYIANGYSGDPRDIQRLQQNPNDPIARSTLLSIEKSTIEFEWKERVRFLERRGPLFDCFIKYALLAKRDNINIYEETDRSQDSEYLNKVFSKGGKAYRNEFLICFETYLSESQQRAFNRLGTHVQEYIKENILNGYSKEKVSKARLILDIEKKCSGDLLQGAVNQVFEKLILELHCPQDLLQKIWEIFEKGVGAAFLKYVAPINEDSYQSQALIKIIDSFYDIVQHSDPSNISNLLNLPSRENDINDVLSQLKEHPEQLSTFLS